MLELVEVRGGVLGNNHLDTLNSVDWLAATYRRQKRWDEAKKLEAQTVQL